MGFKFDETMRGTVEWDRTPGTHPFEVSLRVQADSWRAHLADGKAHLEGTIQAPPIAQAAHAEGVITIRLVGARIIRYELAFTGDDGRPYELVGQKDLKWLAPVASITNLPADILDEDHRRVGSAKLRFDLRHDLLSFVRSFRPMW